MINVKLKYDKDTGMLYEGDGATMIASWNGLEQFETEDIDSFVPIDALCKLKNAGFTADEIVELRRKEVI